MGASAVLALGLAGVTLLPVTGGRHADRAPPLRRAIHPVVPQPVPQLLKPMTEAEALKTNQSIPIVADALQPAQAFGASNLLSDPLAYRAALDCLTAAVYYEANSEGVVGQRAVAQVVLNRVRHPAFPANVCDVVYQGSERETGCQFTFTCDGSLARRPNPKGWSRAREIATEALGGSVEPSVGMATHYHANWVVPYWAGSLDKIAVVGAHLFYRWQGYWGRRQAFNQRYAGAESLTPPPAAPFPTLSDLSVEPSTTQDPPSPLSHLHADLIEAPIARVREDDNPRTPSADHAGGVLMVDETAELPGGEVR